LKRFWARESKTIRRINRQRL